MSADSAVRVVIVHDSWDGHTAAIAEQIGEGVRAVPGATAELRRADEATHEHLRGCDALVMGSPVHQRTMSWPMKRFVDLVCEPAWFYDDLVGRVGAVFTTGGGHGDAGGGCELAQLSMLGNLAACGLMLVTFPKTSPGFDRHGMHWGPHFRITGADMVPRPPEVVAAEGRAAALAHGENIARVAARLRGIDLARGPGWPTPEIVAQRRQREAAAPAAWKDSKQLDDMPTDSAIDKIEIRTLVARFADAAMRSDAAAFRALWTPDAEWRIGEPQPLSVLGQDAIGEAFTRLMAQWEFFAHIPSSVLVEVSGDQARARCAVEETGLNTATGKSYHNVALYFDELQRLGGRWLFHSRFYHYLWMDDRPVTGRAFPAPRLPEAWKAERLPPS